MELCDDCQRMKIAKVLEGMQKFDKHVLTSHNKQFSHGILGSPSLAGKSTLATLEWMSWRKHGPDSVERSRVERGGSNGPLGRATGVVVANLGTRLRQTPLNNCKFCALLANIRIPDQKPSEYSDALVACRYFEDPDRGQRWDCEGSPSDIVILGVIARSRWYAPSSTWDLSSFMEKGEPRGFLTCRLVDSGPDVWQSVPTSQPAIEFGEISRLIQICQQSHQEYQNETTRSWRPIAICLIDCHSRELIQTTSSESYVALSYVWGGVSAGTLDSGTLPRTLEDAIQVTRSLGFKYIWIDQFCVNQHDNAIKHEQIRTMGMVYADAALTLVAATGSDANHGLPGAPNHPFPRKVQHSVVVDGCIISKEEIPIDLEIQNSVWASRGWTFQEQFFSQRFLVFGLEQMSYECQCTRYSPRYGTINYGTIDNRIDEPLENMCPGWKSLWSGLHNRNIGIISPRGIRDRYYDLVAQYWPRQLSLDTDGINAFTAILEHLKDLWDAELLEEKKKDGVGEYRITFTAGMPHLLRHNAESPDPDLGVFVEGLLWSCNSPTKRREGFPSWCWAGRVPLGTHTKYIVWGDFESELTSLISNVFFRSSTDTESSSGPRHHKTTLQRVPIADYGASSIPEAVIFDAPVLDPSAVSWSDGYPQPWISGLTMTSWKLDNASVLKRDELLSNFENGSYCLVALSYQEYLFDSQVEFLLVRQVEQYCYERIGLVVTFLPDDDSWAQCNKDLKLRTWELI